MTTFFDELSTEIFNNDYFKKQYKNLFIISACKQLERIPNIRFLHNEIPDLKYLLEVAQIFAQCSNENMQNISQRIAQYVIEFVDNDIFKQVAYMILELLVNKQAINLAQKLHKLPEKVYYLQPFKFTLENINRDIEYSFYVTDNDIVHCNKFQKDFWQGVENSSNIVSISAPTSAGKSFIVQKWLKYHLELDNSNNINVGIVVPTRALINQFEKDLKEEFYDYKSKVNIISMPFAKSTLVNKSKNIYVFTQERMSIFLSRNKSQNFKAVFIDEAHKVGDNERGVLLQQVIDEIIRRNNNTRVVFAGPFVKNPEDVYINAVKIKSTLQTVDRNYFHICRRLSDQRVCPKKLAIELELNNTRQRVAKVNLTNPMPRSKAKILGCWAYNIGKNDYGNLIYADGGAQAESIADYIYELETDTYANDVEINALIDLCKTIVHEDFLLIKLLKKRIAFHYGSMPQIIRQQIENLFNKKILKYVICTSTLLEGVNLSCKNIFVKEPKKGQNKPMSGADLFNLLGRAGRLGKEFNGNIYYVDWNSAPTEMVEQNVERTTHKIISNNLPDIIASFKVGLPKNNLNKDGIEATVGYIFQEYLKTNDIKLCNEVASTCSNEQIKELNQVLKEYSSKISIPKEILENHPTTYHYSMQKLLDRFHEKYNENPNDINSIIPDLSEEGMYQNLISILSRMIKCDFNTGLYEAIYPALITTSWIRFKNLPTIIQKRRKYLKDKNISETLNTTIRKIFNDVDLYARYKVPKLLSCYVDVMNYFFEQIDKNIPKEQIKDIAMFLEYGINKKTQASMIILGLSRSTIFELETLKDEKGNLILNNENMTEAEALQWLSDNIQIIDENNLIPKLLVNEIYDVLGLYTYK